MQLAVASSKKFLSGALIVRLEKNYPQLRDLGSRLLRMPILKRGNFVDDLPINDDQLIKWGTQRKYSFFYGYKVCKLQGKDTLEAMLLCVDQKGCVVESTARRLDNTNSYVGVKVPDQDIKARNYVLKFDRGDYLPKGYA